jgi:type I restriction enzyme R subunit
MVVLQIIAETIRTMSRKDPSKNLLAAIAEIERLIDEAISGAAIRLPVPSGEDMKQLFDLSTIDFERLAQLFVQGRRRTAAEILRGQAEDQARGLVARNPTRADLVERLNALIASYNAGSMDVERLFGELTAFVNAMDEEEQRHAKEGLSEEELAVFDILTRPEPKLSKAEELQVKTIARQLLEKLKKDKFILDWQLRESAKADVRETIRQEFDELPEVYDRNLWDEKVERTYQFIFEHYSGARPRPI